MTTSVALLAAEEVHNELPMPAYMFGVIALVTWAAWALLMFALTWSFRGTAQKYARPHGEGHAHGTDAHGADGHGH